jgi:hypothetical protein
MDAPPVTAYATIGRDFRVEEGQVERVTVDEPSHEVAA